MNYSDLLYIKTIVETKNISQAAKQLFISQPSLSRALQKMEASVGTPLFNRTKIGMVPTEAGLEFYNCACNIINIYENFKVNVSYLNNLNRGKLTIGITNFLGTKLLPYILPMYHKLYPNIEIDVIESSTSSLENLIEEGKLDFAIMHATNVNNSTFKQYNILQKDHFVLVTSKENSIKSLVNENTNEVDIKDLKDIEFISYRENKRMSEVFKNIFSSADYDPKIILQLTNYQTASRLVAEGMGATVIPKNYLDIFNDNDYPIEHYRIKNTNDIWYTVIVDNPNMNYSKPAQEFIKFIKELYSPVNKLEAIKS